MSAEVIKFDDAVAKLNKSIRRSGIEAYEKGYELARATQADPVLMKRILDRILYSDSIGGVKWTY